MATGKEDGDREADLEATIEAIRKEIWKPGQILSKFAPGDCVDPARAPDLLLESVRRSISLILRIGLPENRTHFSGRCTRLKR
jgi:hypothetical protein